MVKPSKTMQPEAVNLKKAGRDVNKAFAEDSFRNYMARKIDMQRRQFGLLLPPPADPRQQFNPTKQQQTFDQQQQQLPPPPSSPQLEQQLYEPKKTIRFSLETEQEQQQHASSSIIKKRKSDKKFGIHSVLKRLKRRHGKSHKLEKQRKSDAKRDDESSSIDESCLHHGEANEEDGWQNKNKIGPLHSTRLETIAEEQSDKTTLHDTSLRQRDFRKQDRPDLFLSSVVVLVNGYTDPDTETLQRLLHKHGGDLEKYETSRVTHIIAEHLSTAKANMYKRQKRNPRPVCKPSWIVDSVQAKKLLPVCHYLIDEVRDDVTTGGSVMPSVAQYFSKGPGEPDVVIDRQQAQLPMAESTTTTTTDSIKDNSQQHARINNNNNDTMATYCSHWLDDEAPDLRQESADEEINEVSTITHAQSTVMGVNDCLESARIPAEDATAFTKDRTQSHCEDVTTDKSPADDRYINGRIRTVGTDPNFLESFFAASRLSFIGSYKQRTRQSPVKNSFHAGPLSLHSERFVFHVDMDCFFASVVIRNFPEYRDKPVAISHHGDKLGESDGKVGRDVPKDSSSECATCNYEARKFGIEKGMFLGRAKVLCPDLIVLPYDFEGYEVVSDAVSDILDRHAAENTGYVEHVSCDEAYVEFHIRSRDEKPPALVAAELAETIRLEVLDVTQCTASVGVASNKLLAKLATDHVKPNKSFVVMEDGRDLLKSLKLRELHGIGYRSERKLIDEDLVYVQDVWDLGGRGETELCRILGPGLGKKIHGFCQGKDDRPVQPAERKTIGAECNYGVRFDGPYGVEYMVEGLCKEIERRMVNVGVKGTKVTLKVKQRKEGAPPPPKFLGHGSCHNLSKSLDIRNETTTRDWKSFYEVAMPMLADMNIPKEDIRGMGIVVSKLARDFSIEKGPTSSHQSIVNWFSGKAKEIVIESKETGENRRKVQFSEPDVLVGNDCQSETDDESTCSLVVWSDERTARNTASGYKADDIALPALSQIHMSQVEVLPSPLKKQIVSRMEAERVRNASPLIDRGGIVVARDARFRQTDVKRMFRLAAVKAGEREVSSMSGSAISLTQLESLPLEVQLQVANDDYRGLGALSPEKRSKKALPSARLKTDRASDRSQPKRRGSPVTVQHATPTKSCDEEPTVFHVVATDTRHFFRDNVWPLCIFMDENPEAEKEATRQVTEFLCLCITETRLSDVVVLLRSIKDRNDLWSSLAFDSIFESVDRKVQECFRARLDKDWVLL